VGARTWQRGQRFERLSDGGAELTMQFGDLNEAVRFALGFGAEAIITAPAEAVELARATTERIAQSYAPRLRLERRRTG
jgi:predicted DNA-binding transcriptional regulator YafY